jgi:hypothetical protein
MSKFLDFIWVAICVMVAFYIAVLIWSVVVTTQTNSAIKDNKELENKIYKIQLDNYYAKQKEVTK